MNEIKKIYMDENGNIKTKVIEQKDFYKSVDEIENKKLERIKDAVKKCFGDGKVVRYGFMTVKEEDYNKLIEELNK